MSDTGEQAAEERSNAERARRALMQARKQLDDDAAEIDPYTASLLERAQVFALLDLADAVRSRS